MSKPFNIHDWQDKHLREQFREPRGDRSKDIPAQSVPGTAAWMAGKGGMTVGGKGEYPAADNHDNEKPDASRTFANTDDLNAWEIERLDMFRDNLDDMMSQSGYPENYIKTIKRIC